MKKPLAILIAASIIAPQGADAQIRTWNNLCVPGAMACASWSLRLEYDPDGGGAYFPGRTNITLTVANLQGTLAGLTTPYHIQSIAFHGLITNAPAWDPDRETFSEGGFQVTATGNATSRHRGSDLNHERTQAWEDFTLYRPNGAGSFYANNGYQDARLYGCDDPSEPGEQSGWLRTCGGSYEMRTLAYGEIAFTDRVTSVLGTGFGRCETGNDCVSVPEPGTYLLLLAGVFGLGFVGRRRSMPN